MGLYRFLLAASVVVAHSSKLPGISLLDAGLAVKTFFIISGFYMQLILDSKYSRVENGIRLFYTNRALRIYPMYLLAFAFAVLFYLAASAKLHHPVDRLAYWVDAAHLHLYGPLALIGVSQFTVIGLDLTPLFYYVRNVGFHLITTHDFPPNSTLAWRFNFMPHCWSIGAELFFYSLMPLFNYCRTRLLIPLCFVAAASVALNTWIAPVLSGPMNYHFGPMQLFYFLLGILSYRIVYKKVLLGKSRGDWRLFIPIAVVAVCTFSPWWGDANSSGSPHNLLAGCYLIVAATSVPLLFHVTRTIRWDRWIGELSYPMYLLHIPLKWVLLAKQGVSQKDEAIVSGVSLLILTVVAAFLMTYFVDRPIEAFRQRRYERKAEDSPTAAHPQPLVKN